MSPSQTTCSHCSNSIRLVKAWDLAAGSDGSYEAVDPPKLHYSNSVACPIQVAARTSAAVTKGSTARGLNWAAPITDTDSSPAATAADFTVETSCMEEAIVKQAPATAAEEFDIKKRQLVESNIG